MSDAEGCSWREPLAKLLVGDTDFSRSGVSSGLGTNFQCSLEGRPQMPAFGMSWRFSSSLLGTTTLVTKLAFHPMPRMQLIPLFAYSTIAALYAGAFRCLSGQCGSWEAQCLSAVCVQWV